MITLPNLLQALLENKGSDMHVSSGTPPTFRIGGKIIKVKGDPLNPAQTKELCYSVLTDYQKARYEENKELDFSFSIRQLGRFRGNIYFQRGSVAAAYRHIPFEIPAMNSLGFPSSSMEKMLAKPKGLILVTGPAGSGKSTSLAAMIEYLNQNRQYHVLTIEDPIEFVYSHKRCLINQREIGADAKSFPQAIRAALREDPDVVLVGEMRDRETIETALTLAETGQLVLSTLHTNSASQTISRILNVFPADDQTRIRMQLSLVLEGVITQALIPRLDGKGRVLAYEIMAPNPSIRNLIRENKIHQVPSAMQIGQETSGMNTMNQCLTMQVHQGLISAEDALEVSPDQEDLVKELSALARAS